ncbi:MAG: hypothetical protein AB7T06_18360 [Kofleriaceae bacterium]
MRLLALAVVVGCTPAAPPSSPPTPPTPAPAIAATTCPPIGRWTLTATATCAARPERIALVVHAGPPDARDPTPMFDVLAPIDASGRTNDGYGYDRLLRVTGSRETARGCEMQLHMEYVGPHEAIEYKAAITAASGRIRGDGTYTLLLEDCDASARECTCESAMTIDGSV